MPRRAPTVVLTAEDRAALERRIRARTGSQQAAPRARIAYEDPGWRRPARSWQEALPDPRADRTKRHALRS